MKTFIIMEYNNNLVFNIINLKCCDESYYNYFFAYIYSRLSFNEKIDFLLMLNYLKN